MGKIPKEIPVKLICGFIFSDEEALKKAFRILYRKFGKIDFESESQSFNYTDYYEKEFGSGLKRKFISFEKLIYPHNLSAIKIFTNKTEEKLSIGGKRIINIDPGYIDASKLVLATTKDYNHRIYLSKGIFAEVTLSFKGNSFVPWQWSYPDYRSENYIKIFNQIRSSYLKQVKFKLND